MTFLMHVSRTHAMGLVAVIGLFAAISALAGCGDRAASRVSGPPAAQPTASPATRQVEIDLDKAVPVELPKIALDLKPVEFVTPDNRGGWVIRVPGGRPIATPAYDQGLSPIPFNGPCQKRSLPP